jgi:lipid A 4'-phosphatase
MTPSEQIERTSPRPELLILATIAALTTMVFWFTDLDLRAAGLFYHPETPNNLWPHGSFWLWQLFYHGVPVLAALLVIGSLIVLIYSSFSGRWQQYKLAAGCVLLTILLGPGLLVNAIFKDNWCRPRPNQIIEFGGHMHHIPPLMIGESRKGESFPAGHPSIGFSLGIFWLLLRRRRPKWAVTMLITAITSGLLMGVGRMAAGGHFLSDVLWSGYMTFFAALMVYYYILRVPQRRAAALRGDVSLTAKTPRWQLILYVVIGLGVLSGSLFGFPVDENLHNKIGPKEMPLPPHIITLNIDTADVEVQLQNSLYPYLEVQTRVRGFGLPTNRVEVSTDQAMEPTPQIRYTLVHKGLYSERDSVVKVHIASDSLQRLTIHVQKGDISVKKDKRAKIPATLELNTLEGRVARPDS